MIVAGVDAWKGGWAAVVLEAGRFRRAVAEVAFGSLLDDLVEAQVVAVDIPIGLAPRTWRECDVVARQRLGSRASCLFPVPPAEAYLDCTAYEDAVASCRALTGTGFSKQAFALRNKIVEVDPSAIDPRVCEVHPEVSFLEMAGGISLPRKKTWAGHARRRQLLAQAGIELPADLGGAGDAGPDDIFDAAAAAWTAQRIATGQAMRIPASVTQRDRRGRLIAIWV